MKREGERVVVGVEGRTAGGRRDRSVQRKRHRTRYTHIHTCTQREDGKASRTKSLRAS